MSKLPLGGGTEVYEMRGKKEVKGLRHSRKKDSTYRAGL